MKCDQMSSLKCLSITHLAPSISLIAFNHPIIFGLITYTTQREAP